MDDVFNLIQQIRSKLVDLEEETTNKSEMLTDIKVRIQSNNDELAESNAELAETKQNVEQQSKALINSKNKLSKEVDKLNNDVNLLVQKKAELMIDSTRLQKQVEEFKKYEANAWKKLEAKDTELQEREKIVSEKENYSPRSKSFLPPVA